MSWSQLPIGLLLFEQVIDDDQDAMSQSHNRFLMPHAFVESLVIGTQKGALTPCSGEGLFNEGLTRPSVPFARFGAEPFVRADRGLWTQTDPGAEMGFIRKAIHLQSQFGHDNFADTHVDPAHLIENANCLRAAQWLESSRLCGERQDALRRLSGNRCLCCLLFGRRVAREIRTVRIVGTTWYSQTMSNLLI